MFMRALPFVLGAVALVGLGLLLLGVRGRRRGDTPYCARCRYQLAAATALRCSECGAALEGERSVVRGEWARRTRPLWIGATTLLLALAALAGLSLQALLKANFYAYAPTWVVLRDLNSGVEVRELQALNELSIRLQGQQLDRDQAMTMADFCLAVQVRPEPSALLGALAADLLGDLYKLRALDDARRLRFIEQCAWSELLVRARIWGAGADPVVAALRVSPRGDDDCLTLRARAGGMRVGDRELKGGAALIELSGWGGWGQAHFDEVIELSPGEHEASATIEFEAFEGGVGGNHINVGQLSAKAPGERVHAFTRQLTARFRVLPADGPDPIVRRSDPEIAGLMRAAVTPGQLKITENFFGPASLHGSIVLGTPRPVDIAFRVSLETDGRVIPLGQLSAPKNLAGPGSQHSSGISARIEKPYPTRGTMIFRPDRAAAAGTLDVYEVWGGELRFEDQPIKNNDPSPQSSSAAAEVPE